MRLLLFLVFLGVSQAQLDMSKLAGLFGAQTSNSDPLGTLTSLFGNNDAFKSLQTLMNDLLTGDPLKGLSGVLSQQAVGGFANQASTMTRKLKPADNDISALMTQLQNLEAKVEAGDNPEDLGNELEYVLPQMLEEAKNADETVGDTRTKLSGMSRGMRALNNGMKKPDVMGKGVANILDLEANPAKRPDADTRRGTKMVENLLSGLGGQKSADPSAQLTGLFRNFLEGKKSRRH